MTRQDLSSHLSARFGGDFEGGLEGSPLLGGEDGARPLGPARILAVVAALPGAPRTLLRLYVQVLVLAFLCNGAAGQIAVGEKGVSRTTSLFSALSGLHVGVHIFQEMTVTER